MIFCSTFAPSFLTSLNLPRISLSSGLLSREEGTGTVRHTPGGRWIPPPGRVPGPPIRENLKSAMGLIAVARSSDLSIPKRLVRSQRSAKIARDRTCSILVHLRQVHCHLSCMIAALFLGQTERHLARCVLALLGQKPAAAVAIGERRGLRLLQAFERFLHARLGR